MVVSRVASRSRCRIGAATLRTSSWLHARVPRPIAEGPSRYVAWPGTTCTSDRDISDCRIRWTTALLRPSSREIAGDPERLVAAGEQQQDVGHAVGRLGPRAGLPASSSTVIVVMTALWSRMTLFRSADSILMEILAATPLVIRPAFDAILPRCAPRGSLSGTVDRWRHAGVDGRHVT